MLGLLKAANCTLQKNLQAKQEELVNQRTIPGLGGFRGHLKSLGVALANGWGWGWLFSSPGKEWDSEPTWRELALDRKRTKLNIFSMGGIREKEKAVRGG